MGTLYRAKSENFWSAAAVGAPNQWVHVDTGNTGIVTIVPAQQTLNTTPGDIKPIILQSVTVNAAGSSAGTIISDSARGVIAVQKASIQEKDYHYNIPLRGNLVVNNSGGSDLTIAYIRD